MESCRFKVMSVGFKPLKGLTASVFLAHCLSEPAVVGENLSLAPPGASLFGGPRQ